MVDLKVLRFQIKIIGKLYKIGKIGVPPFFPCQPLFLIDRLKILFPEKLFLASYPGYTSRPQHTLSAYNAR